jgi:serine/threonine-protein kinase
MTGQQIGPYRVVREIGRGGMGSVFEAIQPQIERRVAIKVLRAEFAQNQQLVHRFFTEARAVNIVNHPSVVQISEFGQLPEGLAYIVMEFLEGESLGARMKRQGGKLTITESLRLCRQVAAALAAAHSKGIIHRDLKPDNIMIVHDPEAPGGERAKVLDFGIAKVFDAARADQSVTTTGSMVGTPLYMAPEQCRGGGNITDKADVYALGIMLYRMLCGRPPFIGDGSGAVLAMHIYEQPPPLRQFEPSIPDDLAGLVHSLLAKEPQQRPSMAQVAVALEQLKAIHSTGMLSTTDLGLSSGAIYLQHPRTPVPQSQILAGLNQMGSSPSNPTPHPTGAHAIPGTAPSNSVSMTLGSSAAQIAPPPPPRRVPVVALIAVGIFAVVGGAVFGLMAISKPNEKPALRQVQAVPATPRSVRFKVESEPPGATVVRATDQQILGSTPWQFSQPSGSGQLILLLKKQGYADRVVTIDQSANAVVKETLQALVVNMPVPPPADPTPVAPTGPGKGKWKKGKSSGPAGKPAAPETGSTPTQPAATATPTPQPTPPPPPPPPPKEDSHGSRIQVVD